MDRIFIPTVKKPNNQITLDSLPRSIHDIEWIVSETHWAGLSDRSGLNVSAWLVPRPSGLGGVAGHLRLSYGASDETLIEAARRLSAFVQKNG